MEVTGGAGQGGLHRSGADGPGREYLDLARHYERCLRQHGDNHRGVDWPNEQDAAVRYDVMLGVIPSDRKRVSLLDFGCGAGHLWEHLQACGRSDIDYAGLDVSEEFVTLCRSKFPSVPFYHADVLAEHAPIPVFDYVVMNGVFTEKRSLTFDQMFEFFARAVTWAWQASRVGLAFNVMSSHVDWERDDLFHVPMDSLAAFLTRNVTRNFVIRSDYGLYEYTVYLYHQPRR